jgi:putative membrane protein
MLSNSERTQVADAIAEVERRTNAELVTVLVARSDDYRYVAVLWSALAALLIAGPLALTQLTAATVVAIELGVFCGALLVLRIPAVAQRAIPRHVAQWRASNMARRQFLEQRLHHTAAGTGVLIFVSEAERFVEVLADRGISRLVEDTRWQSIVDKFVNDVQRRRVAAGFLDAIAACGEILAEAVPKTADNRNELDDRLIVIGYD